MSAYIFIKETTSIFSIHHYIQQLDQISPLELAPAQRRDLIERMLRFSDQEAMLALT